MAQRVNLRVEATEERPSTKLLVTSLQNQPNPNQAAINAAVNQFKKSGAVSNRDLITAMGAYPNRLKLVLVDMRELPLECSHKIKGAIEWPLRESTPAGPNFFNGFTQYPGPMFPQQGATPPDAVVFYCKLGSLRSPAAAFWYTYWLMANAHQWNLQGVVNPFPFQVCFLKGGFDGLADMSMPVRDSMKLVQEWHHDNGDDHEVDEVPQNQPANTNIRRVR